MPQKKGFQPAKPLVVESVTNLPPQPRRLLVFGTSNWANPLLPGHSPHWSGQKERMAKFEEAVKMHLDIVVTYQLYKLEAAMQQPNIRDAIANHKVILVHCLGNDLRILVNKSKQGRDHIESDLKSYCDKFVKVIQQLRAMGKIVIVSSLLPRSDSHVSTILSFFYL